MHAEPVIFFVELGVFDIDDLPIFDAMDLIARASRSLTLPAVFLKNPGLKELPIFLLILFVRSLESKLTLPARKISPYSQRLLSQLGGTSSEGMFVLFSLLRKMPFQFGL